MLASSNETAGVPVHLTLTMEKIGDTIGSYQILSELGAGGMGTVYLAEHRFLKRRSAIKVLLGDLATRPDLLERFFAEARATSQIEHPGIVRIFDCEVDSQGRPYFVMELLEGDTLAACLRQRGKLPPIEAAGYALAMADALTAAHERGIVHRDLKPDNVFVRPGPPLGIKLVDFGIAKLAGEFRAGSNARTQTGAVLGTPPYMSPEQCRGAGKVDHRTDIYSLGCVLYEMLCGAPPFVCETTGGYLVAHITQVAPEARVTNPEVPAALSDVIAGMLAKPAEDRPRTMREVVELLAAFAPPRFVTSSGAPGSLHGGGQAAVTQLRAPGQTTPPGAPARPVLTTLRSTAGELMASGENANPLTEAPPRSRRGLWVAAGLLISIGAVGIWGLTQFGPLKGHSATPVPGDLPTPAKTLAVANLPTPAALKPLPAASPPTSSRPEPLAAGKGTEAGLARPGGRPVTRPPSTGLARTPRGVGKTGTSAPGAAPDSPAGRGFVVIDFDSSPTGAAICFEGDRRFITVTHGAIQLPFDPRPVTFLVDLPGHSPARVTVKADRDARKVVQLQPLPQGQVGQPACSY